MKVIQAFFVLVVTLTALVEVFGEGFDDQGYIQLCGRQLATMCFLTMNSEQSHEEPDIYLTQKRSLSPRNKRSLLEECCHNKCTKSVFAQYCHY
uniref:Insulin-like peptide transcript variant X15 n=1 Tax=Galleria mellonella TaxID=7137 RepID=A0AA50F509_GALME|nr:insulin-like peptide transcript variant X15 [Galleria mellonella]